MASPTIVADDELIGSILGYAYDGNTWGSMASIVFDMDGTPGDGDLPGRIEFHTAADGSEALTERMRIDSSGNVGIGTDNPDKGLLQLKALTGSDTFGTASSNYLSFGGQPEFAFQQLANLGDNGLALVKSNAGNKSPVMVWGRGRNNSNDFISFYSNDTERMRISSTGNISINDDSEQGRLQILEGATQWVSISDKGRTDSATNMLIRSGVNGGTSMLLRCEANHPDCGGSSNDGAFTVQNDGTLVADNATISTPADYAEYFESTDDSAIPAGTTVLLENGKVRASKNSETPMGVIRPPGASTTVGNAAPMNYYSKYKRDVFGAHIYEEYTGIAWTDSEGEYHNYPSDRIPNDLTPPDDAEIITHEILPEGYEVFPQRKLTRRITNPDYDPSKTYVSREDRDEWNIVGLLGQVTILKGQLTASSWIKMWDIDSSHEMWFIK